MKKETLAKRYLQINEFLRNEPMMNQKDYDRYQQELNEIRKTLFEDFNIQTYADIVELAK